MNKNTMNKALAVICAVMMTTTAAATTITASASFSDEPSFESCTELYGDARMAAILSIEIMNELNNRLDQTDDVFEIVRIHEQKKAVLELRNEAMQTEDERRSEEIVCMLYQIAGIVNVTPPESAIDPVPANNANITELRSTVAVVYNKLMNKIVEQIYDARSQAEYIKAQQKRTIVMTLNQDARHSNDAEEIEMIVQALNAISRILEIR